MELITTGLVDFDLDSAANNKDGVIDRLVAVASAAGRCTDPATLRADVAARESLLPTGIEGGIGIPHARTSGVCEPVVVFGRSDAGIDWGSASGPAHLVFMIAAPEGGDEHLRILAGMSRALTQSDFREVLLATDDPQVVVDRIVAAASLQVASGVGSPGAPGADPQGTAGSEAQSGRGWRVPTWWPQRWRTRPGPGSPDA